MGQKRLCRCKMTGDLTGEVRWEIMKKWKDCRKM